MSTVFEIPRVPPGVQVYADTADTSQQLAALLRRLKLRALWWIARSSVPFETAPPASACCGGPSLLRLPGL
jgi:hypothetical protein